MKATLCVFEAQYVCNKCDGIHLVEVPALDMTDAYMLLLNKGAISFSIRAQGDQDLPTMHPTMFYREGSRVQAHVFGEGASKNDFNRFVAECADKKSFVGLITTRQAIYSQSFGD